MICLTLSWGKAFNFKASELRITNLELRQAQINLLNARMNANMAKYQAKLSELTYLQACGQLLNFPL